MLMSSLIKKIWILLIMGRGGFEPALDKPEDLHSGRIDHSSIDLTRIHNCDITMAFYNKNSKKEMLVLLFLCDCVE